MSVKNNHFRKCPNCKNQILIKGKWFCSDECRESKWKKNCLFCKSSFTPKDHRNEFCSKHCAAKSKMENPEIVRRMIAGKDLSKIGKKISASIMANHKERKRRREFWKKIRPLGSGWKNYKGNHTNAAEQLLLKHFPNATHNFKVRTGRSSKLGFPHMYRLDLGFPNLKLDVEVDGCYHNDPIQKEKDSARDIFLKSLGWSVLRIPREKATNKTSDVVLQIKSKIKKLKAVREV